ncbi:MAG: hypothetical protein DMG98_21800 [Acidobacteria bacterium]|nr:MAG: hypothetical protein DMG98_21800 [Acidobacteriota bacterium]
MKLNALVMSRSHSSIRVLVAAFAELGIEYRISPSASETMETLATDHHSALIVDFDLPHAVQVAKVARAASAKRRPVLFGMIGSTTPIGSVFQAGANFVLYKPLDPLQVLHSLRAAQAFMREDRRGSSRHKSETLAYLQLPAGTTPALVQEVTEHGLSLQAAEAMLPLRNVRLRLTSSGLTAKAALASSLATWLLPAVAICRHGSKNVGSANRKRCVHFSNRRVAARWSPLTSRIEGSTLSQ